MNFDALDISASALHAQRVKMDTIASNIANVNTTRNPDGTPGVYKRKVAVFSTIYNDVLKDISEGKGSSDKDSGAALKGSVSETLGMISGGVKILEIQEDNETPVKKVFNPSHPDADEEGYVSLPNVNIVTEMIDMISAGRAYEANVTTINATKSMIAAAMKI